MTNEFNPDWMCVCGDLTILGVVHRKDGPCYIPEKREWVGLTDEELRELEKQFNAERVRTSDEEYLVIYPGDYWQWQRAIEAKLREKNGGRA